MNYNPRKEYRKTNAKTQELQYIKTSDNQREKKYKQVIRCPIRKNQQDKTTWDKKPTGKRTPRPNATYQLRGLELQPRINLLSLVTIKQNCCLSNKREEYYNYSSQLYTRSSPFFTYKLTTDKTLCELSQQKHANSALRCMLTLH